MLIALTHEITDVGLNSKARFPVGLEQNLFASPISIIFTEFEFRHSMVRLFSKQENLITDWEITD